MCVSLSYNLRNWVVCSKSSNKPLLPIHITKCNKGNKNHQAKEWRDTSTEAATFCEERKTGRNELRYTMRKRKALLRSREFAVVVGGGGGAACWVVVVVGETGKEKGIRRNTVWGRRNRVCGYGGYWLSGFCVYRVLEKFYVAWKVFFFFFFLNFFYVFMFFFFFF